MTKSHWNGLKRKVALMAVCLLSSTALFADWNPEVCFPDRDLVALENKKFKELKAEVTTALSGTWISKEKINLLMDLALIARPTVAVEIGVFKGASILPVGVVFKYFSYGKIFAIDPWNNSEAIKLLDPEDPNREWWATVDMEEAALEFQEMLKHWSLEKYCTYLQFSSIFTVDAVPDEIDFLHLDGDHSPVGSLMDTELYLPKVKSGGYILLSNMNIIVNGKATKHDSFALLSKECDLICKIDNKSAALFRKR